MPSKWEKPVRVAERDIPRYAIHVESEDLKVGNVYFRLSYLDNEMVIPQLVPLVFVGRDIDATAGDPGRFYFQDATSYFAGVRTP
jgi:hypothetical protein